MSTPAVPPGAVLAESAVGVLTAGDPSHRFEVRLGISIHDAARQAYAWASAHRRPVAFRFNDRELTADPDDLVAAYFGRGPGPAERLRCRDECLGYAAGMDALAADPAREDGDRLLAALRAETARELAARLVPPDRPRAAARATPPTEADPA